MVYADLRYFYFTNNKQSFNLTKPTSQLKELKLVCILKLFAIKIRSFAACVRSYLRSSVWYLRKMLEKV